MNENQKLREVLQHAIEDLSSATGFLTRRSRDRQSKTVEALAKLQADIIALPTADHLPDAGKMVNGLTKAETDASASVSGLTAAPEMPLSMNQFGRLVELTREHLSDNTFVYKATSSSGETCHFGVESAAKAWAKGGTVEAIKVREFKLHTSAPTAAPVGERLTLSAEDVHAAFVKHFPKTRISQAWIGFAAEIAEAIAARAALSAQAVPNPWRDAVIEQLESWHIYVPAIHENSPRLAIKALVNIETQAALDPKVSSQAAALAAGAVPDERDKVDAQRYRWLADCLNYPEAVTLISDGSITEDALGKAIDAAMAARAKGGAA